MTRTTKVLIAALALVSVSGFVAAEGEKPKPGPEHGKLGYFVGNWKTDGELKPNPIMPGGKMSTTDVCEWFEGGFSVVCRGSGTGPMGPTKGLGILSYNAESKIYTYYGVDNTPMAMTTIPTGTVKDGVWTYTDESMMNGTMVKSRYIMEEKSPSSYTFKWEMLGEDGKWMTVMEGTSKKTS